MADLSSITLPDNNTYTFKDEVARVGLAGKQDTLVSGTNIKTINSQSLLGSGNIAIGGSDISFEVDTTYDPGVTFQKDNMMFYANSSDEEGFLGMGFITGPTQAEQKSAIVPLKDKVEQDLATKLDKTAYATDNKYGIVKTNSAESVTLDSDGKLNVGGRLGQMSTTTGVYSPKSISPAVVGDGSFLLTEGSGTNLGNKSLAVSTGKMLTCKSAAAGSTTYRISNTYQNRINCAMLVAAGGVVALNENEAKAGKYANVVSVLINGSSFVPSSAPNDSANDIVITLNKTVNPSAATTQIRMYPTERSFSNIFVGQGVGGNNAGASVIVGQGVFGESGNANSLVGADIYNTGNGNAVFGRQHLSKKNRWLMAGTGHDNGNGKSESGVAAGDWSLIQSDTAFVIGNGTSHTARSNLFEIKTNGDVYINGTKVLPLSDGIVLKSPNDTRWKIAVDDSGSLYTTAL